MRLAFRDVSYHQAMDDWAPLLDSLRFNWDEAYLISFTQPDKWAAERRDTGDTLSAPTPLGLRALIIADYLAQPVSMRRRHASLADVDHRVYDAGRFDEHTI
jgi:hypothetical protein